jgi:hypothetical protein
LLLLRCNQTTFWLESGQVYHLFGSSSQSPFELTRRAAGASGIKTARDANIPGTCVRALFRSCD